MTIEDLSPEDKKKRALSANVTALMKHVEAAIDTAMSLNKANIKIPYAKPNALKAYIGKWKSLYRKDWWGTFEMWPDFDHKVLEVRFKKAKYEVKIDFGFDGILFDDELEIDGIISRVIGITNKQSKFRTSQLKESEKSSLRQLKKDFYIEEVGDHFIFTPRHDSKGPVDPAVETKRLEYQDTIRQAQPREQEKEEDEYGF